MPTSTVNKETARETLEKVLSKFHLSLHELEEELPDTTDAILIAMSEYAKSCSSLAWDAGTEYEFQAHFGKVPNSAPDKETYMTNLFPDGK